MISIKNFHWNLLKIGKTLYKNIDIYYIRYIAIKNISDYENIHNVNPLDLIIGKAYGYTEEKNRKKHLISASTVKNKEVLKKYTELWYKIKYLIKTITDGDAGEYRKKEYVKIKFNSDDNLPLNKILQLHMLTVIATSVFQ